MDKDLDEQPEKREYLLGISEDPDIMRQMEKNLLVDDKFADNLAMAEDELIEQFLDNELSDAERERFTSHFLTSPERKEKLRLVRNLRRFVAAQELAEAEAGAQILQEKLPGRGWRGLFSMPALSYALMILVVMGLGYGVWQIGFNRAGDVETAMLAYKGDRPFESRMVGSDYTQFSEKRGDEPPQGESIERRRARRMVEQAAADDRTAQSLHALGKVRFLEKDLPNAINAFQEAARLGPVTAGLMSDLGAAQMEAAEKSGGAEKSDMLAEALRSLDKAIELDPKLLEPRFNRALCLEAMGPTEPANRAWNEYIELDPNSKWTDEARRHLGRLEDK